MFAVIFGWIVIILTALLTTLFILLSYKKIERTPSINKLERYLEKFFRIFVHIFGGVGASVALATSESQNQYRCKHCGYMDSVNSEFCLSCLKDDNGVEKVMSYKCNYCFNTFSTYSKYCPKCARDNNGKYKGGIS